ncbi:MAG: hypothetical protein PVH48_09810 [Cyclobacteriaceae bacterium]|jgi:class 3 adenylate cyclase
MKLIHVNSELQIALVHKHGGKILKEIGDGSLFQFESAYQTVKYAIEIQQNAKGHLKKKMKFLFLVNLELFF